MRERGAHSPQPPHRASNIRKAMQMVQLRSLLMMLAVSLLTVAPLLPPPYDKLITSVAKLLLLLAGLH
jgi:hypothetical protein